MSSPSQYAYDSAFMSVTARSRRSAEIVIDLLRAALPIASVADFGCALGTWLAAWNDAGVGDTVGVDGPYISRNDLQISPDRFREHDLARPIDLGRRFDLVESMEVAEHLPEPVAAEFVASLVRHAELVLFSASPPGQGGEHHVNEQPYEYWCAHFAKHGYRALDWIRPQIIANPQVQYWYRYNLFLFVAAERLAALPDALQRSAIPAGAAVPDLSPWSFRMRKQVVRRLPPEIQTGLSRAMSRWRQA